MHLTGVQPDMNLPYLESNDHKSIKDYIVVMRSPRYRNIFINYNFLNNIKDKIICIGLKQEYEDLKKASIILNFMIVKIFLNYLKLSNRQDYLLVMNVLPTLLLKD